MTPLTPEQVELLRLPDGYQLGLEAVRSRGWYVDFPEDRAHQSARNNELANFACSIANGHLPPEALDDVWRRVEGKPSREAELLRNLVEWYDAALQTRDLYQRYHHPAVTEEDRERFKVATDTTERFLSELSSARKWIEEQKP